MIILTTALLMAAQPGLDNPGCYPDPYDWFRAFLEFLFLISLLISILKQIQTLVRYHSLTVTVGLESFMKHYYMVMHGLFFFYLYGHNNYLVFWVIIFYGPTLVLPLYIEICKCDIKCI